jgi:hypothetical protein
MVEKIGMVRVVGIAKTVLGSKDKGLLEVCRELADALRGALLCQPRSLRT